MPECKDAWEAYRQCGMSFFNASDAAQAKCANEMRAFQTCSPRLMGADRCNALELTLIRCATAKIKLRMSGEKLPESN